MFKNYLTEHFASAFHRSCCLLNAPHLQKERLLKSAVMMLTEFGQSIRTQNPKDELKHLCVALLCLRDCKETLDEIAEVPPALISEFTVLHARLEQLCLKASEAENGQLRLLG